MSDTAYRTDIPDCDIHKFDHKEQRPAYADAAITIRGRSTWAFVCLECFNKYGKGLGTGRGQRLFLVGETEEQHKARIERTLSPANESPAVIEDDDEWVDPDVDTEFHSREHEAAAKYLADLIRKRDEAHNKIALSDSERDSWNRRIAKASVIMHGKALAAKR